MKKRGCVLCLILWAASAGAPEAWCAAGPGAGDAAPEAGRVYWYEGEVKRHAWMALDEIALFPQAGVSVRAHGDDDFGRLEPGAVLFESTPFVRYYRIAGARRAENLLERIRSARTLTHLRQASPVFYTHPGKEPATRLVPTGEIIVQFAPDLAESRIAAVEKTRGLRRVKQFAFAPNTFLYDAGDPLQAIGEAAALYESGETRFAYPNWLHRRTRRAIPDDPLFSQQWHLRNTGQKSGLAGEDVNVTPVWDTFRGSSGEVIAVVDDGLEIGHEDLAANVLPGMSWDFLDGNADPTGGDHGTSVAGVAAARGFNDLGITGAAPLAGLVGHRLLGAETDANEAEALSRNSEVVDIYTNSWGPADDGARLEGPGPLSESAIASGIRSGRSGLGCIYVWAGGNGYDDDNSNYDGYANSRYTIAVAASTNLGRRAFYSEKGANLLVSAPSDGGTLAITTTDRTGRLGFAAGNYVSNFGGTSSAAPLAAGVVALMLQANPNLSWRDVQHILLTTAQQIDPADPDWQTNGVGLPVNHKYGFGRIDASAAVTAAVGWSPAGPETVVEASASPHVPIPDNDPVGITSTLQIDPDIRVEFVEVYFTAANHSYWGDLEIMLTSPAGTRSVLAEGHSGGRSHVYNNWRFGSARLFGESSRGAWTLTVSDRWARDQGTLQSWRLRIHGTKNGPAPAGPPEAVTETASAVKAFSALLSGSVNPRGAATTYYFDYGSTTAYGMRTEALDAGSDRDTRVVSVALTGLLPEKTYHYRIVASNSFGTARGEDRTFTTGTVKAGAMPWLQPLLLDP